MTHLTAHDLLMRAISRTARIRQHLEREPMPVDTFMALRDRDRRDRDRDLAARQFHQQKLD